VAGETDSQLVNSVYVDNFAMELYHGRLDKTPGAIALRLRWYGTGAPEVSLVSYNYHEQQPTVNHVVITEKNTMIRTDCSCDCKVVFVERKTHRESWAGDISVKERFTIQESQVLDLLSGKFSVETEMEKLKKKGD
jgi:SPX domain protein involved in polyphosphate accumulation